MPRQLIAQTGSSSPCYCIADRQFYQPCHIQVPDVAAPFPAIQLGERYYSFLKGLADPRKALGILIKLMYQGDEMVLAITPKGYALWVWEPDAILTRMRSPAVLAKPLGRCQILVARDQCQPCLIQVPDLDQQLAAIRFEGDYYSHFRTEAKIERLLDIAAKVTQRGDDIAIARTKDGYAVYIREPDARLLETA